MSADDDGLVWHYTDGPGLLSIVRNHLLWSTAAGFLNDEEEIRLGVGLIAEVLRERSSEPGPLADLASAALDRLPTPREDLGAGPSPSTFFILSAAQHWDLLAMWRCYGGPGESYAIGLDATAPLPVLIDAGAEPRLADSALFARQRGWSPVRYQAVEQRALADAVLDGLPEEIAAIRARLEESGPAAFGRPEQVLPGFLDDLEQAMFLIKHVGFHDEREIRHSTTLFSRKADLDLGGVVRYRSTSYGIAPYLWLTGTSADGAGGSDGVFTSVPGPLPIRRVAISPSRNGDQATESCRAMLCTHGYDVDVIRSSIPFRT